MGERRRVRVERGKLERDRFAESRNLRIVALCRPLSASPEKQDVDVCPQPDVIGQIPTDVVWILINHDLIAVPKPISAEVVVIGGHAEVETAKPEALGSASREPEAMTGAKPAREAPMLPRVREMVMRIVRAGIMPDPLTARVDVGSVWMPRLINITTVLCGGAPFTPVRSGTMRRNVPMTNLMIGWIRFALLLPNCGDREHQQHYKKCVNLFHASLL